MNNVTVNISFQDQLLAEIEAEAARESRSRSDVIVSGDKHLLDLGEWDGVRIIAPAEFVKESDVRRHC